jgi:hypothetical protein
MVEVIGLQARSVWKYIDPRSTFRLDLGKSLTNKVTQQAMTKWDGARLNTGGD